MKRKVGGWKISNPYRKGLPGSGGKLRRRTVRMEQGGGRITRSKSTVSLPAPQMKWVEENGAKEPPRVDEFSRIEGRLMGRLTRLLDARLPPTNPEETTKGDKSRDRKEASKGPTQKEGAPERKEDSAPQKRGKKKRKKGKKKKGAAPVRTGEVPGSTTTPDPRILSKEPTMGRPRADLPSESPSDIWATVARGRPRDGGSKGEPGAVIPPPCEAPCWWGGRWG